jgi:hypothetical protein
MDSPEDETLQRRATAHRPAGPAVKLSTAPSQWLAAVLPRARRLLDAQSSPPCRGATSLALRATGRPQRSSRLLARTGGHYGRRQRCSHVGATGGPPNLHDKREGRERAALEHRRELHVRQGALRQGRSHLRLPWRRELAARRDADGSVRREERRIPCLIGLCAAAAASCDPCSAGGLLLSVYDRWGPMANKGLDCFHRWS